MTQRPVCRPFQRVIIRVVFVLSKRRRALRLLARVYNDAPECGDARSAHPIWYARSRLECGDSTSRCCSHGPRSVAFPGGSSISMTYVTVPRPSRLPIHNHRVSPCRLGDIIKGDIIFKKVSKPRSPEISRGLRCISPPIIYIFIF